jgi:protein subunit release factor A
MSNNQPEEKAADTKYTAKSELERLFSTFENLSKDAEITKALLAKDPNNDQQAVLTMSSIGKLGRFGNQLFQYAFLRICAERSGARIECPPWVGQALFGH